MTVLGAAGSVGATVGSENPHGTVGEENLQVEHLTNLHSDCSPRPCLPPLPATNRLLKNSLERFSIS